MAITLITGVPGTGKTAFVVSELEKVVASGRVVFVDNIPGLNLPVYRAGKITEWHKGTWLHIDQYKKTALSLEKPVTDADDSDDDGNENWIPRSDIFKSETGALFRKLFDDDGNHVDSVPYESHKGALLVIDECQRFFRPRAAGSAVPDHVAALEVHRHQGLDIWLITQRPGLVDANVRALCGKHIALRSTPFGRYKYEWPEVGDIDTKSSRDTAARTRYKLPKHVFGLYKSSEVHTKHKHSMPFVGKALLLLFPVAVFLFYSSFDRLTKRISPEVVQVQPVEFNSVSPGKKEVQNKKEALQVASFAPEMKQELPDGFERYDKKISGRHPYDKNEFSIVARLQSATKDIYRFSVSTAGQHSFYASSDSLVQAGYTVISINDCSAKLVYQDTEFFVSCNASQINESYPQQVAQLRIE